MAVAAVLAVPAAHADDAAAPTALLVELKGSHDSFRNELKAAKLDAAERFSYGELWNGVSVSVAERDVAGLAKLPSVKGVFPVLNVALPAASPDLGTALGMTGADVVQNTMGLTGRGVKVAVIDSGVDYNHPDLGGCFGGNCRVAFGHDFVGDAFDANPANATYSPVPSPDGDPDDCNGHGTHVAGIVGANGGVKGVAPGVTFGAYRVFGCGGSTSTEMMLAAMERVARDGVDVVNMSFSSAFAAWPQYPTAVAADRLAERGVVVVASMGNNGSAGLWAGGAPGLGAKVIAAASFDNVKADLPAFSVTGLARDVPHAAVPPAPAPSTGTHELVRTGTQTSLADACAPGGPTPPTFAQLPRMEGKVALIRRGTCSFYHKAMAAQLAGATAVVFYNSAPARLAMNVTPIGGFTAPVTIPVVSITGTDGNAIDTLLRTQRVWLTWTTRSVQEAVPTAGLVSSLSSWGLAADLSVKPDLGAPGGFIRSTYPVEKNSYANISGTSQATPHIVGAAALLLEAKPDTTPARVRTILQNSADARPFSAAPGAMLDAVHRQGAGLLDVDDAIRATTLVEPAALALGEGAGATRTITITNTGSDDATYTLAHRPALATGANTFAVAYANAPASVSFSSSTVSVPAGGSASVEAAITANAGLADRSVYGGYLVVSEVGGSTFAVPYAGFKGDYQSIDAVSGETLSRRTGSGTFVDLPAGGTFTLVGASEVPYVRLHFAHPARRLEIQILDAASGKPVHPVFSNALEQDYLGRAAAVGALSAFAWNGTRLHDNGAGNGDHLKEVRDGRYKLVVKVLKALGDPTDATHWETWTSPTITIDRP